MMAEKIGEFTMEHVVSSYSRNTNGDIVATSDWKGSGSSTALGGAQVFGTFITAAPLSESDAKSGTMKKPVLRTFTRVRLLTNQVRDTGVNGYTPSPRSSCTVHVAPGKCT